MTTRIDLFDSTYSNFTEQVLQSTREETFGRDIGQNSWLTADEYGFATVHRLTSERRLSRIVYLAEKPAG